MSRKSLLDRSPVVPDLSRGLVWVLRGLCSVALGISAYLAWTAFNAVEVYGCGGDLFDCGHVLSSGWSKWFGIPVSMPAFALYASLLAVLAFFRPGAPDLLLYRGWQILTVGGVTAGLAALWFIGLQVFVIQHFCVYCLTAHFCGLCLAVIVLWRHPLGAGQTMLFSGVGVLGLLALVTGQVLTPAPQTWVVESFEESPPSESSGSVNVDGLSEVSSDLFAAPDGLMAAPDEGSMVFTAPGEAVADSSVVDLHPAGTIASSQSLPAATVETEGAVDVDSASSTEVPEFPAGSGGVETVPGNSAAAAELPESSTDASVHESRDRTGTVPQVASSLLMFFSPSMNSTLQQLLSTSVMSADDPVISGNTTSGSAAAVATQSTDAAIRNSGNQVSDNAADANGNATAPVVKKPEPRIITAAGGKFKLNAAHWPIIGSPDARYVVVEMFDYTCPHCRNTHRTIKQAMKQYGNDLAIITLAVPLNPACNSSARGGGAQHMDACELAKLAVAVWRVSPEKYGHYHDWLFDGGRNRTAGEARQYAEQIAGREALQAELSRRTASEYIARHVELYRMVGAGSVPKLLFPKNAMTGDVGSVAALSQMIQREFPSTATVR